MDFINKQNFAVLQSCQKSGEIVRFVQRRSACHLNVCTHLVCDDQGQCCLSKSGRAGKQNMFKGFAATLGGFNKNSEIPDDLVLSSKLIEVRRTKCLLQLVVNLDMLWF